MRRVRHLISLDRQSVSDILETLEDEICVRDGPRHLTRGCSGQAECPTPTRPDHSTAAKPRTSCDQVCCQQTETRDTCSFARRAPQSSTSRSPYSPSRSFRGPSKQISAVFCPASLMPSFGASCHLLTTLTRGSGRVRSQGVPSQRCPATFASSRLELTPLLLPRPLPLNTDYRASLALPYSLLPLSSSRAPPVMPETHPLNLKVLQRHDPSIVSIVDSATYVVLYAYDGEDWIKEGIEGSMFIFKR